MKKERGHPINDLAKYTYRVAGQRRGILKLDYPADR